MQYTPSDLVAAFATLPDPRRVQGRRFPLAAMLALAVVALLSNHLSVLAIATLTLTAAAAAAGLIPAQRAASTNPSQALRTE